MQLFLLWTLKLKGFKGFPLLSSPILGPQINIYPCCFEKQKEVKKDKKKILQHVGPTACWE